MTDRVELLRSIDLEDLLEDLGDTRGLGRRGQQFPCPSADHDQSGRTPPASVTGASEGYGVWHCHSCGAGGTAVDALLVSGRVGTVGEAFATLEHDWQLPEPVVRAKPREATQPDASSRAVARAELDAYVEKCERRLRTVLGRRGMEWLLARGLTDDEIRRNRIGFDPGYREAPRERHQLPAPAGASVALPLLDAQGNAIYAQARQLAPDVRAKYLNPSTAWIGPSPRVGLIRPSEDADERVLIVAEGIIDAISAGRCFAACALIGAQQGNRDAARDIVRHAAGRPVVVCLDADAAGRLGSDTITQQLVDESAACVVVIAPRRGDVNDLLRADPAAFADRFSQTIRMRLATARSGARTRDRGASR